MTGPGSIQAAPILPQTQTAVPRKPADQAGSEIGRQFEKMLWAEMLSHAGLEKSLTLSGGEAASAFSRFVIDAIAEDLAEKHPLGLDPMKGASEAYAQLDREEGTS